jgi:hypothetical protein
MAAMSTETRLAALYAAWLLASITEIHEVDHVHAGVNVDHLQAPHQWADGSLPDVPPLPPRQTPLPLMVNNSQMIAAQWWQEEENRNALATMEVVRKNARNAALLTVLSQRAAPASPVPTDT